MEHNVFYQAAQAIWKCGSDGEKIARELAQAFRAIVEEGATIDHTVEYARLSSDGYVSPSVHR